jgi:chitosanase
MATKPIAPKISDLQKKTIQAIVNVFETGSPRGDYGAVTMLPGDAGHLTYGRSQMTLGSGNLCVLLRNYVSSGDACYAAEISPYLNRVDQCDVTLDSDSAFHSLLKRCGEDPVMQQTQDKLFDDAYWVPTLKAGGQLGLTLPLSYAIAYDSHIQGAWAAMVEKTNAAAGLIEKGIPEKEWIRTYVHTRKAWLSTRSPLLAKTTYRMDAFITMMASNKWNLDLPITFLKNVIEEKDLR